LGGSEKMVQQLTESVMSLIKNRFFIILMVALFLYSLVLVQVWTGPGLLTMKPDDFYTPFLLATSYLVCLPSVVRLHYSNWMRKHGQIAIDERDLAIEHVSLTTALTVTGFFVYLVIVYVMTAEAKPGFGWPAPEVITTAHMALGFVTCTTFGVCVYAITAMIKQRS
jgi:preprotein translocase subunit SecG